MWLKFEFRLYSLIHVTVVARGGTAREMPKFCIAYVQFSLASPSSGGNVISCTINRKIAFSSATRENLWLHSR